VGILRVISDARTRQPRDGQMKCGNQPAHISMINRRQSLPRVAFPFRCEIRLTFDVQIQARIREFYACAR
jgi:hypothetical protein